ncbi:Mutant cadherin [Operophtera brumata]|uniref:Mutant cadherin n=1 Tax=Operophtera brumata TaxID=104452 RepID=A0A0L7LV24_OPEBR|nr:Mutant cadherin [Operophtera brumata]
MNKTLILVLAFGAVALAAPGPHLSDEKHSDSTHLEKITDDHIEKHDNIEKTNSEAPALEAVQSDELITEAEKKIEKRHVFLSYPYAQYRFGYYNPYRYGYNPLEQYEPVDNVLAYPYRSLVPYIPGFALLAFIQNKIDVMSEESIVRICTTSFTTEEIEQAKSLLFESITTTKRKITRKRDGRSQRDLFDVISVFKETDPDETPNFVARMLQRLPSVLWDHLEATRILKDILVIQSALKALKETCVTVDKLEEVKSDLFNLKQASIANNYECYRPYRPTAYHGANYDPQPNSRDDVTERGLLGAYIVQ